MKCIKRFFFTLSILLLILPHTKIKTEDQSDFDFFLFDQNDDNAAEIMHNDAHHMTRFPKDVTLATLTNLGIENILKTELYQTTPAPLSRSPLDISILQIMTIYNNQFKITPFISTVWQQNYTDESCNIDSYINLKLHDIITVLAQNEFTTIQVPEVLELFTPLKMQEHTAGFMFQGVKVYDNGWAFTYAIPLQYTLNNFYLTQDEKERIENYPLFAEFNGDMIDFARNHLMSDRLGIGDTQLTAEYCLVDTYRDFQSIGTTLTIPTAFAFKKGLIGTYFNPDQPAYKLNLYSDLIDPYLEDIASGTSTNTAEIQQKLENFGLAALNRLSTLTIQRNMGQDYHWAIGSCYRATVHFNDYVSMISKVNFEVKMPSILRRFFLVQATPEEFAQFDWADNNVQVDEKIAFLNMQFNNMFFPTMYYATIFPGVLFHSTSCLKRHMPAGRWAPMIGLDSWFHSAEHIISINAPDYDLAHISKQKSRRGKSWSSSLWVGIEKTPSSTSMWNFEFKGYISLLNAGFGDAYGIAFTCEKDF